MEPLAFGLFRTPVVIADVPSMAAHNEELATRLVAESEREPTWQRSNIGGWHSVPNLAQRTDPAIQTLMRATVDETQRTITALAADAGITDVPRFRYGLTAWAMVMRDGHYIAPHDHGEAHWSSAYYVDAGDDAPAPSGRLTLLDPRRGRPSIPGLELFPPTFDVVPRTCSLVLFPGWLVHHVHPYRGQRPRISIACNVTLHPIDASTRP